MNGCDLTRLHDVVNLVSLNFDLTKLYHFQVKALVVLICLITNCLLKTKIKVMKMRNHNKAPVCFSASTNKPEVALKKFKAFNNINKKQNRADNHVQNVSRRSLQNHKTLN